MSVRAPFAAVAVVVALGGFAERAAAQIPAADGTFYACVRVDRDGDEGKLARLVAAAEPCRRNEKRVHWSQTGPQGVPGTNGTNGTATRAAGPCFDNTNRYVNCLNGTVTDTVTGLIWLQQADCLANATYSAANQAAAALANLQCGLTDGSSPGDWRLPTRDEWSATLARAVVLGCIGGSAPSLTKDAGTTCFGDGTGSSFAGVAGLASDNYWSSTASETTPKFAWLANLFDDVHPITGKPNTLRVWPVRGGPR